jgi:hypothetical protein
MLLSDVHTGVSASFFLLMKSRNKLLILVTEFKINL